MTESHRTVSVNSFHQKKNYAFFTKRKLGVSQRGVYSESHISYSQSNTF